MLKTLDDILEDDSLFESSSDSRLFNTKRYRHTITAVDKKASRKRMKTDFTPYQVLFQSVQADIASGKRQIKSISDVEISQKSPIKKGNFYIDNGIMLYVAKIYHPDTKEEFSESTTRKHKVHLIYENGTENHIWLLSLVSSLYDTKRSGRLVTESLDEIDLLSEQVDNNVTTGHIYVVKYAGQDQRFLSMANLYKIGVAKDIQKRLCNTVNEATYLFAPVQLIESFEIQNMEAKEVESYLHHVLADKRVDLVTQSSTGKEIRVTEWFIVDLEHVRQILNQLTVELQKN
ncbi:GIY-YIG nuclease family protein [Streptococcus sp. sy010]|uniref:GIY-YIG nuclease family protein n=1 Tax=Streptococcus sp. sy010 TaxID=2600148 RepID=UPI0011B5BA95|nr:GIY-YIG nuclease family protein [Streptococcus sp. sy010]TWT16515.1 GIY-YIG nuclease family protein [Streptococcus sp. sy010]